MNVLKRLFLPILVFGLTAGCADVPTDTSAAPDQQPPQLNIGTGTYQIQIDARTLSAVYLNVYSGAFAGFVGYFAPSAVTTVNLDPGDYTLAYLAQTGTRTMGTFGGRGMVAFSVTPGGMVDFPVAADGILNGRGTAALEVTGVAVTIDVSPLSANLVGTLLDGPFYFNESGPTAVNLLPGEHFLSYYTSGAARDVGAIGDNAVVEFTIATNGTINYQPELEGILLGGGTTSLVVQGTPVTLDVSPLSASDIFTLLGFGPSIPLAGSTALRLLPGLHFIGYETAVGRRVAPVVGGTAFVEFTVRDDGTLRYDPALEGVLSGQGTDAITTNGAAIGVDVSALTATEIFIRRGGLWPVDDVNTLRFLPGKHWVGYQTTVNLIGFLSPCCLTVGDLAVAEFNVLANGSVDYDPGLEGLLMGDATSSLTVVGRSIGIDLSALSVDAAAPFDTGLRTRLGQNVLFGSGGLPFVTSLRLLPGPHEIHYVSAGGGIGGVGPFVEFSMDVSGALDYDSSLDLAVAGRGGSRLEVRGVTVTIDATCLAFDPPEFYLVSMGRFPTGTVRTFTVLPGGHRLDVGNVDMILVFETLRNGLLDYAPGYNANLAGRGTKVLKIKTNTPACNDLLAPAVTGVSAAPNPVPVGTPVSLTAMVDDAGTGGSFIAAGEYALDGGSFNAMVVADGSYDEVSEAVSAPLGPYSSAGIHEVCVRGSDASGNIAQPECILVAVYDPNGGFVTGGGWITSPPGAYFSNPAATGKANFGFVSKYQKGANVPTGSTEFQFRTGNLNFHSTVYEWLVVAGPKAQYKGSGTIDGVGDYKFMLTAIDGVLPGGGGVDKFRIKIWNNATGVMVYDNQSGAADSDPLTTAIQGGSIVIHK